MKRQPTEWMKIFANHKYDRVDKQPHKEVTQFNSKEMIQLKMGRGLRRAFFQRRHRDGPLTHEKMLDVTNH